MAGYGHLVSRPLTSDDASMRLCERYGNRRPVLEAETVGPRWPLIVTFKCLGWGETMDLSLRDFVSSVQKPDRKYICTF